MLAAIAFIRTYWKAIAFFALLAGTWYAGWHARETHDMAQTARAQQAAQKRGHALQEKQTNVEAEHAKKQIKIVTRTQVVYRTIAALPPGKCIDDPGMRFVEHWNAVARQAGQSDAAMSGSGAAAAKGKSP